MCWTSKEHRKNQDILGVVRQSVRVALTFPDVGAERLYLYGAHQRFAIWREEWTGECEGVYIEDPRYPDYPAYFLQLNEPYQPTPRCGKAMRDSKSGRGRSHLSRTNAPLSEMW